MKKFGSLSKLVALTVFAGAIAWPGMVQAKPGKAVVRALQGTADYTEQDSGGSWDALSQGQVLFAGSTIRTGSGESQVDLYLGINGPVVRITKETTLAIDTLSYERTGLETVIETGLDLKEGRILGRVKKMAETSRYEVQTPNGVAGIRGTKYDISTLTGLVRVLEGIILYVWRDPNGALQNFTINAGQAFNPQTGSVVPIDAALLPQLLEIFADIQRNISGPEPTGPLTDRELVDEGLIVQERINQQAIPPVPYDPEDDDHEDDEYNEEFPRGDSTAP